MVWHVCEWRVRVSAVSAAMTFEYNVRERRSLVRRLRNRFRANRAAMFRRAFDITASTTILDLGGRNGAHIASVLAGTEACASNCLIADINRNSLDLARKQFGFRTAVLASEDPFLPFAHRAFDIVFCSSVLEHVAFPSPEVWSVRDGPTFRTRALESQARFAAEIRRVAERYFVQVPYRHFPIETHTRIPLFQYLPRALQLAVMKSKRFKWLRQVPPDFYLPTKPEFQNYFPDGRIQIERFCGVAKSLIAVR